MIVSTFEIKKIKRNYHQTHRNIMSMFGCRREDNNVLFMQINDKLIVQSDCPPKSINKSLRLMNSRNCDSLLDSIKNEDIIKIFAVYEPTECKKRAGRRSANISIKKEEARKDWVKRKFIQSGEVLAINEISKNVRNVKKDNGNQHTIFTYEYEFLLNVKNSDELKNLIKKGVGRSRAYGDGMSLIMGVKSA